MISNNENPIQYPKLSSNTGNIGGYIPPSQYTDINNSNYYQIQNTNILQTTHQAPLINNQEEINTPTQLTQLSTVLKTDPQVVDCPYCKTKIQTITDQKINIYNFLCCLGAGGLFWLVRQSRKGKDINCYNSDHYCPKCKNVLVKYNAC
jgi:hypothetical protein